MNNYLSLDPENFPIQHAPKDVYEQEVLNDALDRRTCPDCNGSGFTQEYICHFWWGEYQKHPCIRCVSSGYLLASEP